MKKKVGIIKRLFTLFLVFLLSINSFAAIVSDNDGSAFITKAEFDALKNSFQAQIDTYNSSIDSKIDGAIASYLAGIKLSTTEEVSNKYASYAITGLIDGAGLTAPLYWTSNANYTWNANSSVELTSHNILSSNDYSDSDKYGGHFEWTLTHKNVLERCAIQTTVTGNFNMCVGVYDTDQACFFMTSCQRYHQAPGHFGHANNTAFTYGVLTTKSDGIKGQFMKFGGGTSTALSYNLVNTTTYQENYYNWVQGTNTGLNYATIYAIAPYSTKTSYGISDNIDTLTWDYTNATQPQLNNAPHNRTASQLQTVTNMKKPTTIDWADCSWPAYVKWKCDSNIKAQDIIYRDFFNVDSRNREIKCGLVLCEVQKEGKYTIYCTPSKSGKIILYKSATALSNRGSTNGTQKNFNVNAGVENTMQVEVDTVAANEAFWIVYTPTNAGDYGTLSNVRVEVTRTE